MMKSKRGCRSTAPSPEGKTPAVTLGDVLKEKAPCSFILRKIGHSLKGQGGMGKLADEKGAL